ncbi:MAG: hypothetical protein ABIJ56_16980 [Pseudomonadota bacterium]
MNRTKKRKLMGYTLVEVMAALLLFGVGLLGIMAMEVVATKGNRDSHDLTVATTMGEWWLERLHMESLMWNVSQNDFDANLTPMLLPHQVNMDTLGGTTDWVAPPGTRDGSTPANPRYDKWMRSAATPGTAGEFCAQYRLTTITVNELVRAEVRVMWWKNPERPAGWAVCPTGMLNGADPDTSKVRSVTVTGMLWRHPFNVE